MGRESPQTLYPSTYNCHCSDYLFEAILKEVFFSILTLVNEEMVEKEEKEMQAEDEEDEPMKEAEEEAKGIKVGVPHSVVCVHAFTRSHLKALRGKCFLSKRELCLPSE